MLSGPLISAPLQRYRVGRQGGGGKTGCFNLPSPLSHLALRGPWGEFKRRRLDRSALLGEARTSPRMDAVSFIIRGSRRRCDTTQKLGGGFVSFFLTKGNKRRQFTDGSARLIYTLPLVSSETSQDRAAPSLKASFSFGLNASPSVVSPRLSRCNLFFRCLIFTAHLVLVN